MSNKQEKICLVIPSLRNGGSERVISELANSWVKKEGIKVFLILLTNQEQFYDIDSRVQIVTPTRKYTKNILSKFLFKIWTFYYIRSTCNKIKPDYLLSFSERYNNIVLMALLGTKFKKFVSDRNNPFMNIGKLHNFLRNLLYRRATGIIAQTNTAKQVLNKNTKNSNISVIPNPLRAVNKVESENNQKMIVLNVGRNVPQKNQLELIEIFSQCNYDNWELKILGNGPLRAQMLLKVKDLKLENHVQIIEFTRVIDRYFSEASIFAFPSLYEGFPNALVEAMAHGLACVAYDCPTGPKDIIVNDKNGFLVPLSDKEIFKEKLTLLMQEKELRFKFSEEAKKVRELYSSEKIADKYLNFILKT